MTKVSKSKIIEDIKNLDNISAYDKKITNSKTKECIITIKGNEKDMSNNKGFNKEQLEQIAQVVVATVQPLLFPIVDRLNRIESRLGVVEKDVKDIKSLPTIENEMKLKNKKDN